MASLTKLFFLFFLCGICLNLSAQQYGYVQYQSESGAPFDLVNTVLQDSDGFVWIGSQNGLYRFDGINYDIYSIHTESQSIHKLHANQDNLLFLNDKGVYQIKNLSAEPKISNLLEASINETEDLPFYPNNFIQGKDQAIWLSQSNHSVGRWLNGEFKTYHFSKIQSSQSLSLQEDAKGNIWALSPLDGLFVFNQSNNSFEKRLELKNGNTLLIHNDQLIIGKDGLQVYSLSEKTLKLIKTIPLKNDQVTAIRPDQNDQFYVGTSNGNLYKVKDFNVPPQTIYGANEAHRVEKLDFGHINEIYITTDIMSNKDKLWISTETGLWLLQQRFFKTVDNLPMNNPIGISISDDG